jgi:serine/threonine protein phosphatase PrpC
MPSTIIIAHRTDVGVERQENQDAYGYWYDAASDCHLMVVADGMGGAACGGLASNLAVQIIYDRFFDESERQTPIPERFAHILPEVNRTIYQRATTDARCHGMGSTCVLLAVTAGRAYLAHVGDSRIYLIRDNRIARLTRDHSRVQRMLDDGLITEEEAVGHPESNVIERSLGPRAMVEPDIRREPLALRSGDTFVLCTDGLTGLVRDEEIFEVVNQAPAQSACEALVELANERGGYDNITVGILRVGADVTRAF